MGESRKVQQTPTGTFFVCLPRNWAKKNNLMKGSLINIEVTNEGNLFIDSKYGIEPPLKVVTLGIGPFLGREIIGCYLLGYDTINIEAKDRIDSAARNIVKTTAISLAGLEIVEETISKISLQSISQQPFGFLPGKILQRNCGLVTGMIRDVSNSFVNGDLELAKSVVARDNESNRLYFLLVRILRTIIQNQRLSDKLGVTPIECLDYRLAASLIEGIGDACVQVAQNTIALNGTKFPEALKKSFIELHSICCEANENAFKAFLSKDISIAEQVRELHVKIEASSFNVEKVAKAWSVDLMPQILAAVSSLRQIYERSVDMADLVV
jgi:phosphate uptake regulator